MAREHCWVLGTKAVLSNTQFQTQHSVGCVEGRHEGTKVEGRKTNSDRSTTV